MSHTTVEGPGFSLDAETHEDETYPVDGWWWWFESLEDTMAYLSRTDVAIVTMRQARLALLQHGLLASVETAIDAMDSPQKEAARIEWDYSSEVHRNKQFVTVLASALGLTETQLDDLFELAATL